MTLLAMLLSLLLHATTAAPVTAAELDPGAQPDHPVYVVAVEWSDPRACGEDFCWLDVVKTDTGTYIEWNGHNRPSEAR